MMDRLKNNKGIIYITALAMMLMFVTYGLVLSSVTQRDVEVSQNTFKVLKDFYSAEAGIEHAIADIYNGGTGIVDVDDLYTDNAGRDYQTAYEPATNTITSRSSYLEGTNRQVIAKVNGVIRALISGGAFVFDATGGAGTIDGDIEHGDNGGSTMVSLSLTGRLISHEAWIQDSIPTPTTFYEDNPDHVYLADVTFSSNPNPPITESPPDPVNTGIIYVNGNVFIEDPNVTINGTLVATGDVHMDSTINPCHFLTIDPLDHYPAIIAGGSINADAADSLNFQGLVFAGSDITFNTCTNLTIIGAVVTRGVLTMTNIDNFTITYDPTLDIIDPGSGTQYFLTGTGKIPVKIANWIGHGPMP